MAVALIFALTLAATTPPPPQDAEPLPPGAPQDEYLLAGWCYGALAEYLEIYDQVKPDLIDIDRTFGTPVKEAEPYQSDIAAMHVELKVIGGAIVAAEKASAQPIAPQGALAIRAGQGIWQPAEAKTRRELARAWLSWGLPDRCDANARQLTAKANVLGRALSYNNGPQAAPAPAADAPAPATDGSGALTLAPIAPVVTHMAPPNALPTVAMIPAAMAPPTAAAAAPASDSPAAQVASAPPTPPPPAGDTPAPTPRVMEAAAPPPAQTVVAPVAPTVQPTAQAAKPPAAVAQPTTDQSSEPVL